MPLPTSKAASPDLHALLLEMSDEGVLLLVDGRVAMANAAAALLLGAPDAAALLGAVVDDWLLPAARGSRASYPRRRRVERGLRGMDGRERRVAWCERACRWQGKDARQVVFSAMAEPAAPAAAADQLTELPTRRQFRVLLQAALDRAVRNRHLVWVLYVDLDRFSAVNAAHGHAVGDRVLAESALRLARCIRRTDFLASAGGDEFLLALEGSADLEGARVVATRALQALAEPFLIDGASIRTSASVGACAGPADGADPDALLRHVDLALAQAKAGGRARVMFYSPDMDDRQRRSALAREATERKLASLTPREHEVLEHLVEGQANKMIAYTLGASMRTIEHHRARIMDKMEAGSLPELVRMVIGRNEA